MPKNIEMTNEYGLNNENGPAYIEYDINGNITTVQYFHNGKLHNPHGPASINYNKDGTILLIRFYIEGQLHNDSGPAVIVMDENGNDHIPLYYLYGNEVPKEYICGHQQQDHGYACIGLK